jgi:aerobic-type carbon monoxide dehydrogenase small subunit (CoxS/CutS family)
VSLFISPLNRRGRGIPDTIILPLGVFAKCLRFCTPGILMLFTDYLSRHPRQSANEIRDVLSGHLCRCTGYAGIVAAIKQAAGGE